jgi:cytochrome b
MLSALILLRILWGIVGTRYARFSSFALHPKALMTYLFGIFRGSRDRWTGHNPASSWAAIVMFTLGLGLGITGFLMANGQKEDFEDLHEILANSFIVVVSTHVIGVMLHAIRHRDRIERSMFSGIKTDIPAGEAVEDSKPMHGLALLVIILTIAFYLAQGFDRETRKLPLFGATLQLGDPEE